MKDIDKLLEKYFEGETSLQEESTLRNYFRQPNVEERHKVYASMFNFFSEERKEVAIEKKKKKIPLYMWVSIAASLLLIVCVKTVHNATIENDVTKTIVYIDGKKVTDIGTINMEAINSIENISEMDEDVIDSQIGILDSFTD